MNEDRIVSCEVAKLLKEKGFDWNCYAVYDTRNPNGFVYEASKEATYCDFDNINIFNNSSPKFDFLIGAPTQSLAQKWLREVHNIDIIPWCCNPEDTVKKYDYVLDYDLISCLDKNFQHIHSFNSYEEALEEGIKQALNKIVLK